MGAQRHGATHTGLLRPGNEDAFHVGRWSFAVADGVGGGPAGEVASRIAVERVARLDDATPSDPEDALRWLTEAARDAARQISADISEQPGRAGMATTLTAAAIWDQHLVVAHIGDSRAYLFRGGRLERLTDDHTVVEEAVREGRLSPEEAARHPHRHVLVRVLSADPTVSVSTLTPRPLEAGDRLLLCSDGLTEPCDDDEIARLLGEDGGAEAVAGSLVDAALQHGGPDNVTVVVVDIEGDRPNAG